MAEAPSAKDTDARTTIEEISECQSEILADQFSSSADAIYDARIVSEVANSNSSSKRVFHLNSNKESQQPAVDASSINQTAPNVTVHRRSSRIAAVKNGKRSAENMNNDNIISRDKNKEKRIV